MTIITRGRIGSLGNIARWRGWTTRPFSVCEHTTIGTEVARQMGASIMDQKAFLMHDIHETEIIGDVPTPDKREYVNEKFHVDVRRFDRNLSLETGVPYLAMTGSIVKYYDNIMLKAENHSIVDRRDPEVTFSGINEAQVLAYDLIRSETHRGERAVEMWWGHYRRLWDA